jgi:hypothetical protein
VKLPPQPGRSGRRPAVAVAPLPIARVQRRGRHRQALAEIAALGEEVLDPHLFGLHSHGAHRTAPAKAQSATGMTADGILASSEACAKRARAREAREECRSQPKMPVAPEMPVAAGSTVYDDGHPASLVGRSGRREALLRGLERHGEGEVRRYGAASRTAGSGVTVPSRSPGRRRIVLGCVVTPYLLDGTHVSGPALGRRSDVQWVRHPRARPSPGRG